MRNRQAPPLPASLSLARRRFEQWRNGKRSRRRLPEELWSMATGLAREHGVNRTAKTLRLDYYSLKKRLDAAPDPEKAASDFIEIFQGGISPSRTECAIELEDGTGAKMRIHFKGSELPDLAAITREFRRDEA